MEKGTPASNKVANLENELLQEENELKKNAEELAEMKSAIGETAKTLGMTFEEAEDYIKRKTAENVVVEKIPRIKKVNTNKLSGVTEKEKEEAVVENVAETKEVVATPEAEAKKDKTKPAKVEKTAKAEKEKVKAVSKDIKANFEKEEKEKLENEEKKRIELELEMKLDAAREKYTREYDKCKKEYDKEKLIDKTRNSVFNILAGVKNIFSKKKIEYKKSVEIEDYFTEKTLQAKKEYNQTRIEKGNLLYATRKEELEKAGLTGEDLENALTNYKATEILSQTIIEERQKIIDMKAEKAPIKIALWKRMVDGYMNIKPRWKKVALSTILFLPLSAMGAVGAGAIASYGAVGLGGLALVKFGASMAIGAGVGHLAKGIDLYKKGSDLKFQEKENQERSRLESEFSTGKLSMEEYEKGIELIENEEKKRARNRTLLKFGVGGALALAAGYGSYTAMGYGVEHLGGAHAIDATSGADMNHSHLTSGPRPPLANAGNNPETGFKVKYPFPVKEPEAGNLPPGTHGVLSPEGLPHPNIEVSVLPGKGAIATLRDLQHSLKVEYGNDLTHAPASVKHILETDAHKLAQEYGMYKPGQDAESALIKAGSTFKVDSHGNLTYHEGGGHNDLLLEKGTDVKADHLYEGKMSDTHHPGSAEGHKLPEQVDHNTGAPVDQHPTSEVIDNPYKLPAQVDAVTGEPVSVPVEQIDPKTGLPIQPKGARMDDSNLNPKTQTENLKTGLETLSLENNFSREIILSYQENMSHLFPTERMMDDYTSITKSISAEKFMDLGKESGINDSYKPLFSHLEKLEKVSGLKPVPATLITEAETIPDYSLRALKKIAEMKKLDDVNLTGNVLSPVAEPTPDYLKPIIETN